MEIPYLNRDTFARSRLVNFFTYPKPHHFHEVNFNFYGIRRRGSAETEGLGMGLRNADLLGMEFYLWDYGEPVLVYILYKHVMFN